MEIIRGTRVIVTDAHGRQAIMVALDSPARGLDFPILWVCTEQEFESHPDPDAVAIPWPLAYVDLGQQVA